MEMNISKIVVLFLRERCQSAAKKKTGWLVMQATLLGKTGKAVSKIG